MRVIVNECSDPFDTGASCPAALTRRSADKTRTLALKGAETRMAKEADLLGDLLRRDAVFAAILRVKPNATTMHH